MSAWINSIALALVAVPTAMLLTACKVCIGD